MTRPTKAARRSGEAHGPEVGVGAADNTTFAHDEEHFQAANGSASSAHGSRSAGDAGEGATDRTKVLEAALTYIKSDWHVIPLHSVVARGCSCGKTACKSPGKHPRTKNGLKDASTDEDRIRSWWKRWPDANVGIVTGAISGIWVLDIDPRNGGDVSLEGLGDVRADVEQETGGRGSHLVFEHNGTPIPTKNGVLPGIDVKGDGGYIVAPPSNHISGGAYTWLAEADPTEGARPGPAPPGLLDRLFPATKDRAGSNGSCKDSDAPPLDWAEVREQLASALEFIAADDRDMWLAVGMGLKRTGGGEAAYEMWREWSARSNKFDPTDQRRVWESINDDRARPITARSIFYLAKAGGWAGATASRQPEVDLDRVRQQLDLRLQQAVVEQDATRVYEAVSLVCRLSQGEQLVFIDRAKSDLGDLFGKTEFVRAVAAERKELAAKQKEQKRADAVRHRAEKQARAEREASAAATASGRKVIHLFDEAGLAREPLMIHNEAVQSLVLKNKPERIFQRGSHNWRLCKTEDDQAALEVIGDKELSAELLRSALFIGKNDDGVSQPANPPRATLSTILGAARLPFPDLAGIVHAPVMRTDGSILLRPGYDAQSKLLHELDRGLVVPQVSVSPTKEEITRAREYIDEIFCQFPFKDDASRANAFALLLTGFIQPALQAHRPICAVTATVRSSGKTLLVNSCASVLTGRPPSTTRWRSDEELEKKLAQLLQRGASFIGFDNVKQRIESATLEAILTARRHQDRILGHNDRGFDVPQDAVWALTANNPDFGSEMARRTYTISLDPKVVHPEDRRGPRDGEVFKRLEPWVREHRGRLVWAALTLCRAWWVVEKPKPDLPPFGSFEEWQDAIGGILQVAGVGGFLANRSEIRDSVDTEHEELEGFLRAIQSCIGARACDPGVTVAEIVRELERVPDFAAELPGELAMGFARRDFSVVLGNYLRRMADRPVAPDGLRIVRGEGDRHAKARRWRIVTDA